LHELPLVKRSQSANPKQVVSRARILNAFCALTRTRDIQSGVDLPIAAPERLPDQFTGVEFGAMPGLPPVDPGGTPPGADPIRLGAGSVASFSAMGTSSSGTVYIRGRRDAQYAVRIFGETGKTRIVKFERGTGQWRPR